MAGPALAEVAFENFAQAEIRRMEELRLVAPEARIDADLQLGRYARLIGEIEALLAKQPVRERVASKLMLALYRARRDADALAVYRRTSEMLRDQLGLEPSPAVQDRSARSYAMTRRSNRSHHGLRPNHRRVCH